MQENTKGNKNGANHNGHQREDLRRHQNGDEASYATKSRHHSPSACELSERLHEIQQPLEVHKRNLTSGRHLR